MKFDWTRPVLGGLVSIALIVVIVLGGRAINAPPPNIIINHDACDDVTSYEAFRTHVADVQFPMIVDMLNPILTANTNLEDALQLHGDTLIAMGKGDEDMSYPPTHIYFQMLFAFNRVRRRF